MSVERLAYRHRGAANLHPSDAALNLPEERHSHGLRRLAAVESTRGSYDEHRRGDRRVTGVAVAKRQVEELAARSATDVDSFHETAGSEAGASDDVLTAGLSTSKRTRPTHCTRYLVNKADYLGRIATGVIEGTCRYLVADRMGMTGARWSVQGAEAVLKLLADGGTKLGHGVLGDHRVIQRCGVEQRGGAGHHPWCPRTARRGRCDARSRLRWPTRTVERLRLQQAYRGQHPGGDGRSSPR